MRACFHLVLQAIEEIAADVVVMDPRDAGYVADGIQQHLRKTE